MPAAVRPKPSTISDEHPTDQLSVGATAKTSHNERSNLRVSNTYTFRIEYAPGPTMNIDVGAAVDNPSYLAPSLSLTEADIQPNWSREFTVHGRHTLEQLNEIILHILGWEGGHLYEFRIADRVYAHMIFLEEDELFVEVEKPCVSCDIPIRYLGFSVGDIFAYIYDFGDYHVFRVTVLDVRAAPTAKVLPTLLSLQGKNIIQYPGILSKAEARAFRGRAPTVVAPEPVHDSFRVRFIRDADVSVLREWRASNNKTHWQKAVAILENRNLSIKDIARKIERAEDIVQRWIKAFNRFGLEGINKPDGRRAATKTLSLGKRAIARDQRVRRILEIVHAKPSAYGINRSNWSLPSIARAYEQEHKEAIGKSTVGVLLQQYGYAIRKARKVLTSPDPNYREKVDLLLNTLQNLKPGELLFFVDEL